MTIFLKLCINIVIPVYPITSQQGTQHVTLYPFTLAYATTMCKPQGQTLQKAILWFDIDRTPPGAAYVALSRVKKLDDLFFLIAFHPSHFTPVKSV